MDSEFNKVELLLHFDGSFVDSSPRTKTVSSFATISSAQSKFGGSSGLFSSYLIVDDTALSLASSTLYTAECWIYPTSAPAVAGAIFFSGASDNNFNQFQLYLTPTRALKIHVADSGLATFTSTGLVPLNAWSHVAVVRNGSDFSVYLNGNRIISATSTRVGSVRTSFHVGLSRVSNANQTFPGYMDDVRITQGVARYSGTSLTVPTEAFPNVGPPPTVCQSSGFLATVFGSPYEGSLAPPPPWPEGDVIPVGWASTGDRSWYEDSSQSHSASISLRADVSNGLELARLVTSQVDIATPGTLAFWLRLTGSPVGFKVWHAPVGGGTTSELLNLDQVSQYDGVWREFSLAVPSGVAVIQFELRSSFTGSASAWLDDVVLPVGEAGGAQYCTVANWTDTAKFGTPVAIKEFFEEEWPGDGTLPGWSKNDGTVPWVHVSEIGRTMPGSMEATVTDNQGATLTSPTSTYVYGGTVSFSILGIVTAPSYIRVRLLNQTTGSSITLIDNGDITFSIDTYPWHYFTFDVPSGQWRVEFSAAANGIGTYDTSRFYLDDFSEDIWPRTVGFSPTRFGIPQIEAVASGFYAPMFGTPFGKSVLRARSIRPVTRFGKPIALYVTQSGKARGFLCTYAGKPYYFKPWQLRRSSITEATDLRATRFGTPTIGP